MQAVGQTFLYSLIYYFNAIHADAWTLHLLKNDGGEWTAEPGTIWAEALAEFEASYRGYAPGLLTNVEVSWDAETGQAKLMADEVVFQFHAAAEGDDLNHLDGWALTYRDVETDQEVYVYAEHFEEPIAFFAEGHQRVFAPNVLLFGSDL